MRAARDDDGAPFARLLQQARRGKRLRQEDVWGNTSVSRATYGRWERGEIDNPEPAQVREVCLYLGTNPVLAFLALGWITCDELNDALRNDAGEYDGTIRQVAGILRNPSIPAHQRAALDHTVKAALGLWSATVAMPEPHEPSGAELNQHAADSAR